MLNTIPKFRSISQWLRYTRLSRAPSQLIRRWKYPVANSNHSVQLRMRLGHRIELAPTQPYLQRVIWSRSYHDEGVFFLEPFLSPQPVLIDIGANIGLLSCAYAQLYGHLGPTIFAIEAVEQNYLRLLKNIELNGFKTVKPFRYAFGKESGSLTFKLPSKEFSGNAVGTNVLSEGDIRAIGEQSTYEEVVPMVTLDAWAQDQKLHRCDFIKVDVEGAEIFVFQGGKRFIERTRPVVQCEYNGYWLEQQGLGLKDYLDFFLPLNYVCYVDQGSSFKKLSENSLGKSLVDLLFVPQEKIKS